MQLILKTESCHGSEFLTKPSCPHQCETSHAHLHVSPSFVCFLQLLSITSEGLLISLLPSVFFTGTLVVMLFIPLSSAPGTLHGTEQVLEEEILLSKCLRNTLET